MFLHNPVLDAIWVFACLYIFRPSVLSDETANDIMVPRIQISLLNFKRELVA